MLWRRQHVVVLNAQGQCHAHLPQQEGILTVGFLGAPPGGMTQEIDADTAEEIAPMGAQFAANRLSDPSFQLDIESGAPGHGNRKACGMPLGDTARAVVEEQGRNSETLIPRADGVEDVAVATALPAHSGEETVAGEHEDLLLQREILQPRSDPGLPLPLRSPFPNWHFSLPISFLPGPWTMPLPTPSATPSTADPGARQPTSSPCERPGSTESGGIRPRALRSRPAHYSSRLSLFSNQEEFPRHALRTAFHLSELPR